jgi:hypothetical protein
MDVEDAIKFMKRERDLKGVCGPLECYGQASTNSVGNARITCRCSLFLEEKNLIYLSRIWEALAKYGLKPDFYVVWDLIPYSFIVDWLIPIGNIFQAEGDFRRFSENYNIGNVCFSLKYLHTVDGYEVSNYYRWPSAPLKALNDLLWLEKPKASGKTIGYRILDTISLISS